MAKKRISKIVVPLDGSKNSFKGLEFALGLAKGSKAAIGCVYVIPRYSPFGRDIYAQIQKKAKKAIAKAKTHARKEGIDIRTEILYKDNIGHAIIKYADKEKADLIVIGSRGPDPHSEMFFGSIANYIIHKSKIPATVVK